MPQVNSLENPTQTLTPVSEVGTKEDLGENVSAELAKDYNQVEEKIDYQANDKTVEQIQADIVSFRENIKLGETRDGNGRYNEQLILENEAKLRKAEQLLADKKEQANNEGELATLRKEIENYRENIKLGETKDGNGRYNEQLILENEAKLREAEKKMAALNSVKTPDISSTTEEVPVPAAVAPETPKKKKGFFSKMFSFGRKEK